MADDKNQEYPFARANGYPRSDQESGNLTAEELKRKKRIKLAIYIVAFIIFQVTVITAYGLTVMKVKSPKLRLANIEFQTLTTSTANSSSFDMSFTTQVRVKNTNFGRYKFDAAIVNFTYGDAATVGQVVIPKGKVGMKSTKKINNVIVNLSSTQLPNTVDLSSELTTGTLTLGATAKMTGKVELMLITRKKKSANMNCTITIDVAAKTLRTLQCK